MKKLFSVAVIFSLISFASNVYAQLSNEQPTAPSAAAASATPQQDLFANLPAFPSIYTIMYDREGGNGYAEGGGAVVNCPLKRIKTANGTYYYKLDPKPVEIIVNVSDNSQKGYSHHVISFNLSLIHGMSPKLAYELYVEGQGGTWKLDDNGYENFVYESFAPVVVFNKTINRGDHTDRGWIYLGQKITETISHPMMAFN